MCTVILHPLLYIYKPHFPYLGTYVRDKEEEEKQPKSGRRALGSLFLSLSLSISFLYIKYKKREKEELLCIIITVTYQAKDMGEEQKETESTEKEEKKEEAAEEKKEEEPSEIVLKVDMHCEGCARKVEKSLRKFEGVEDVKTDSNSNMVVVKAGKAADPVKVCERVQKKTGKKVELISPLPKPPEEENKEAEEEEKKEEPKSITVVLKVRMHCEACAQGLQKRIRKMEGVESVVTDLSNDQVIVKGVIDPGVLVENVYRRTRKQASIVQDEEKKEEEKKPEEEEKKPDEEKKEEEKKPDEEKKEEEKKPEEEEKKEENKEEEKKPEEEEKKEENKEEEKKEGDEEKKYEYWPYRYPVEYVDQYAYTPVFSDENPNACSVM